MTASVTFDRSSLTLSDLVITGQAPSGDGFFLAVGGLFEPSFDVRSTYAPDSAYTSGSQLLAAVLAASTMPLVIVAQASTAGGLTTLKAELAAACFQFTYPLTLTAGGETQTWQAGPCWPVWGEVTSPFVDIHVARAAVVVPVNP